MQSLIAPEGYMLAIAVDLTKSFFGCVRNTLGTLPMYMTRLMYCIGLLVVTLIGWVLRNWGGDNVPIEWQNCAGPCFGILAPMRVTFALAIYHLVLAILTIGVTKPNSLRGRLHNGAWLFKFVLLGGITTGFFFIDPNDFPGYAIFQLIGGALFLVVIAFILMDISYTLSRAMGETMEDSGFCARIWSASGVILVLLALFAVNLFLAITVDKVSMGTSVALMGVTFFVAVFIPCCSEEDDSVHKTASLFTVALVGLFSSYVFISAIGSRNDLELDGWVWELLFWFGLVGAFAALVIPLFTPDRESSVLPQDLKFMQEDPEEANWDTVLYSYSKFHVVFMLAALYAGCILTNWVLPEAGSFQGDDFAINQGMAPYWTKFGCGVFIQVLYLFSLIFPLFFPEVKITYHVF